ncbi:MAG: GTPase ObgE [Candidatus Nomurabacteria bacterium]|jgi:GTP-binding protein|nr:GTPase ObgE [Candidatus Nomurabacteria bacterium]
MFVDTAKVFVEAGKGGAGAVSFRHEIYVPKGGPDGGDGGRGGDVIFKATKGLNTLLDFRYQPELKAKPGASGGKQNMAGKSGENLVVKVPVGTVVMRGSNTIADFTTDGQEMIVAKGGKGGFGNAHFKSSVRQTPRIAEIGEPGERFEAELELKLLADVGLVGLPNAGKSTFLSVVSNARPEIADYEFTTLTPNLGVADIDESSLLIADIPGLIEGASEGKGLGYQFLRHVERTSVILHLIDSLSSDVAGDYTKIRKELEKYSADLAARPEIIALTKVDAVDDEIIAMQSTDLSHVTKSPVFAISSSAHQGTTELLRALVEAVNTAREQKASENDENVVENGIPVITLTDKDYNEAWEVIPLQGLPLQKSFQVNGGKIERFALRTDMDNVHSVNRLRDIMKKMGIANELIRLGAEPESVIEIAGKQFTLLET